MLKYPCLILDHDDTVVQSEATVNYPCFCEYLKIYRPGMSITLGEYVADCSIMTFIDMCKTRFSLTEAELQEEYLYWKAYAKSHIPDPFPGMKKLLHRYRAAGGKIFVSSMSADENIRRDYLTHYDLLPDEIFGCDLPEEQRKPNTFALEQIRQKYGFSPEQMLMVDDMKFAVEMARRGGCPIAFAGWGRKNFPAICEEMENLCDYSFYSTKDLEDFLFL